MNRRVEPGPGQESVWDYPRPPRLEPVARRLTVVLGGVTIAATERGHRVCETAGAPVYYFPPEDVVAGALRPAPGTSVCEWKGTARYFDVLGGDRVAPRAAFAYDRPAPAFRAIAGHVGFYARPMDGCFVDGEKVTPQPGGFYAGWITRDLVGPFKGEPGTEGW